MPSGRTKFRPERDVIHKFKNIKPKPLTTGDELVDAIVSSYNLTQGDVAKVLGCSVRTLQKLNVPRCEIGGMVRYNHDQVCNWVLRVAV